MQLKETLDCYVDTGRDHENLVIEGVTMIMTRTMTYISLHCQPMQRGREGEWVREINHFTECKTNNINLFLCTPEKHKKEWRRNSTFY